MPRPPRAQALALWQQLNGEYERYQAAVRVLPVTQLKIQDDMRRYLCLRCAGFLEQVTFEVLSGYLNQKGGGPMYAFATSWFNQAPNLNAKAFAKLIGRFGRTHAAQFEDFLTPPRRESLGDLLGIRNDVAHGKVATGQRLQPDRYIQLCEDVYDWLIATFLAESVEVLADTGTSVLAYERSV